MSENKQVIMHKLFKADQEIFCENAGVWRVDIGILKYHDSPTNSSETILSKTFLVLPNNNKAKAENATTQVVKDDSDDVNESLIRMFWSMSNFCIKSSVNFKLKNTFLFDELFKQCKDAYWSTYYPDPKSDVKSNLGLDLKQRLFPQQISK